MMGRTFHEQNLDSVQSGRQFPLKQDSSPPLLSLIPPNTEISNVLAISDLCSASFGGQVTVLRRPLHVA